MPSNDGTVCSEKSLPIPIDTKPSTSAQALKKNAQDLLQVQTNRQPQCRQQFSVKLQPDKSLYQCQEQKWSQYFNFDAVMHQLRVAEYYLQQNKCGDGPIVEGSMTVKKCNQQLRQVQSLEGCDMHYFGIAPKQKALNAVICNICSGIYTTIGFNNHMHLRHPKVWNNTSTEVDVANISNLLDAGEKACRIAIENANNDETNKMPLMPPPPAPTSSRSAKNSSASATPTNKVKNTSARARSKSKQQNADNTSSSSFVTEIASVKDKTPERQTSSHNKNSRKSSSISPLKDNNNKDLATTTAKEAIPNLKVKSSTTYTTESSANVQQDVKPTLKIQINTKDIKEKITTTTQKSSSSKRKVVFLYYYYAKHFPFYTHVI